MIRRDDPAPEPGGRDALARAFRLERYGQLPYILIIRDSDYSWSRAIECPFPHKGNERENMSGRDIVTVKLELKPEIEAALLAQAHARGLTLEAYLDQVLQNATTAKRPAGKKSLAQLFAESPLKGLDLSFDRNPDVGRPVKL